MRKCKKCGIEKELQFFRKREKWFTHTCKECLNAPFRTGKEHTGRFKKGDKPSPETQFKKGQQAHNKGKKLSIEEIEKMKESYKKRNPRTERGGKGRNTTKYREWQKTVSEEIITNANIVNLKKIFIVIILLLGLMTKVLDSI